MQKKEDKRFYFRAFVLGVLSPICIIILLTIWAWCIAAIYFSNLPTESLRTIAAWGFGLMVPIAFLILPNRLRSLLVFLAAYLIILTWWSTIRPSHNRDWITEVAILPYAEIDQHTVTIHNIRNFDFHSENNFTAKYYDKTYRLDALQKVDLILSYWDNQIAVAHAMLSFGFSDGHHLVASVETRLEKGEPQDGLRGLFKQYELIYVLADENDIVRLRTTIRNEDVFLYPTRTTPNQAKELFIDILTRVNEIKKTPQFYNTLAQNCALSLITHLQKVFGVRHRDIRQLFSGFGDKLAFDRGWIETDRSFAATKALNYVNQYLTDNPDSTTFSKTIRRSLDLGVNQQSGQMKLK